MFAAYTCPQIDKNIQHFKAVLESHIESMLQEVSPLFAETSAGKEYLLQVCKDIYEESEDLFEDVRTCNEDLRAAADERISELENTCASLEQQLDSYE